MSWKQIVSAIFILFLGVSNSSVAQTEADAIFFGGDILTMNPQQSQVEALAVKNGKIIAVGSLEEINRYKGKHTQVTDLQGKTLMPGFIEPHGHPIESAFAQLYATDIRPFTVKNKSQMDAAIQQKIAKAKPGQWLLFYGLDPILQKDVSVPTLADLDRMAPQNPLMIFNNSGHAIYANSLAFKAAGVTAQTPNPPGGVIQKDASGQLTGTLLELPAEMLMMGPVQKTLKDKDMAQLLRRYYAYLASNGITSVSDMSFDASQLPLYQTLARDPAVAVRVRLYEIARTDNQAALPPGGGNALLKQNGIKWWADGSPWLGNIGISKPYLNTEVTLKLMGLKPNSPGSLNYPKKAQLQAWVEHYFQQGYQIAIHAEGDLAIGQALEVMESAAKKFPNVKPAFRLEHAPMISDAQLARAKKLNVPVSFLMAHIYYWGDVLPQMFGEARAGRWNPAGSAQRQNVEYSFHNDGAVTPESPLLDFQIAVLRKAQGSGAVLDAAQRIDIDQALRARTLGAAYQMMMEKEVGSLETGKFADLVVLSANPRKVKAEDLTQIKVLTTYLSGRKVWYL